MDSDYYDDEGSQGEPTEQEAGPANTKNTALLPKSFFPEKNLQVGNTCEVKIVRLHDSEVEVSYGGHSNEQEEKSEPEGAPQQPMGSAMGEMME